MDMVQSQGKMNKKVATLMTSEMVSAVDILIACRTQCGIRKSNKFIFANQKDGHLSTWQSLRDMVNQAGCQRPELINSNSLRKYIATVCQILDLNEGEVQWVSSHLAQTVRTHLGFYRLQEGAIEIAKVSRLLLAAENGTLSKYKGQSLEDIQVDDLPLGESDDIPVHGESADDSIDLNLAEHWNKDDEQPAEAQSSMPVNQRQKLPRLTKKRHIQESDSEDEQPAETQSSMPVNQRPKRPRLSTKRHIQESDSEDVADDDSLIDPSFMDSGREESSTDDEQTSNNFIQQQKFYKQRWSETENKIFIQIFSACLKDKHMPTLTAIKLAASKMPQRTVALIRTRVHNIITGKQAFIL